MLFEKYTIEKYCADVKRFGIKDTWNGICQYVLEKGEDKKGILNVSNFGEMYEIGLEIVDKELKKKLGQYYTPEDVALVMSQWFDDLEAENVCDVGCGTGNLILTYFDFIGKKKTLKILEEGKLYLYENDSVALQICKTSILLKYGNEFANKIHDICCDFLDENIILPKNCKVISNPPYSNISNIPITWEKTEVLKNTKELYSIFMEKIIKQSEKSVIITPYSFIGGSKFYSLRELMNNYNGFIVSFDNVPGNIFNGRKYGIFNSNTSNSVRAAITVVKNEKNKFGFQLTPLIRFKNEERYKLLQCNVLEDFIYDKYQIVSENEKMYYKCFKELANILDKWKKASNKTVNDYVCLDSEYVIAMPNTCRYYTTAANSKLNRNGQILLNFNNKSVFSFMYCLINSSFAYWYWRLYDGGITYPKGLVLQMPVFYDILTEDDIKFFEEIAEEMIKKANDFIVRKNNMGIQENIKFPREYRDKINKRIFEILQINEEVNVLDIIHSNMALEVSV